MKRRAPLTRKTPLARSSTPLRRSPFWRYVGRHSRRGSMARQVTGERQDEARTRKRRERRENRQSCVRHVRDRDEHHCRLCGRPVQYTNEAAVDFGEVHEWIFRSLGGSDVEPTNCVLLCKGCHTATEPCVHPGVGHRTKRVIRPIDSDALMDGPIYGDVVRLDDDEGRRSD